MLRRLITVVFFLFIILAGFSMLTFAQTDVDATKVMEKFKQAFPEIKAESIRKADIEGMYEISTPGKILYYFPEKNYLFTGSIWNSEGKNLTSESKSAIITEKVKKISLEKALKFGKGERIIIEFTDPDCPYCRDASKYLSKQENIVRYVFFLPLPMHKNAEQKIRYIFCEKDKEKAYKDAMNGQLDNMKFTVCKNEKVEALINEHKHIAATTGINSTPQFWIDGRHVEGADIPLIEKLLGGGAKEPVKNQ
ncbi:MAG: DsbC family protein [Proteobacteria bacterium]|nr:DsbC family protein [Pseudomonadota bacterium]